MWVEYTPHAAQSEIHAARDARFRTVCCGRRFGKTRCMAAEIMDRGGGEIGGDYGWVAPTYAVADRGVEAFRAIAPDVVRVVGRMPTRIEFDGLCGPCRVWFLSADNPDSIRGFGFLGLVIDEAAAVPLDVWNYALRPTLAQTMGWAVFISTPAGRNWFYDLFTRGVEKVPGYKSFTFPSNVSPYFPEQEWLDAKRDLPEVVFRQEYMAEFLEDSSGVFRGVSGCLVNDSVVAGLVAAGGRRRVIVGLDVAKHTDWTVLVAMDARTGRCLEMDRFNQIDWPFQRDRIAAFVRKWDGQLVMDATGVGDPIYDDLRRVLPRVEGFKLTAQSKRELVQGLMVSIEQRRVSWPSAKKGGVRSEELGVGAAGKGRDNTSHEGTKCTKEIFGQDDRMNMIGGLGTAGKKGGVRSEELGVGAAGTGDWEILTNELKRYEYQIGPTGQLSYSAPSGFHDDCVIALALADWGRVRFGAPAGSMRRIPLASDCDGGRACDGREVGSGYVIGGTRARMRIQSRRVRVLG